MTIGVGFKCCDGVVLATDSLYTGATQVQYGPKMWILQDQDPIVMFAAAGSVGAMERATEEIRERLKPRLSLPTTLELIDRQLARIHRKFPPINGWASIQVLVGIRIGEAVSLYQTEAHATALIPVTKPWVCIGQEAIGGYFAKFLFKEGMSIEWASVVAAHLIWNCKEYADGFLWRGHPHWTTTPTR